MNTSIAKLQAPTSEMDRRAAAVADVQQMHEDIRSLLDVNSQLKTDNAAISLRLEAKTQESDRHRREMLVFRDLCTEMTTSIANIGLLTVKASDVVARVHELTSEGATNDKAL